MRLVDALKLPREQAQYWAREGVIDETDWELYRFYWRNSAPRFSDLDVAYQLPADESAKP